MSIYPVRLWHFVKGSDDEIFNKKTIRYFAKVSTCCVCGREGLPPTKCWGYHSVPWGSHWETAWCNEKCYEKGLKR